MAFVAVQVVGEVFRMKFGESRIVNSNLFDNAEEVESVEGAFILQREILEIHALLAAQLSPWSSHDETYTAVFSRVGLDRISSRYGVQLCDTLIVEGELYQLSVWTLVVEKHADLASVRLQKTILYRQRN